jgi:hypothetical protein
MGDFGQIGLTAVFNATVGQAHGVSDPCQYAQKIGVVSGHSRMTWMASVLGTSRSGQI